MVTLAPGGFLQATAEAEQAMADFALEALKDAKRVADLFSGCGAFALRLAEAGKTVWAVDADRPAIAALTAAAKLANLSRVTATARDLERQPLTRGELKKLDALLLDPPRAGAKAQAADCRSREIRRSARPDRDGLLRPVQFRPRCPGAAGCRLYPGKGRPDRPVPLVTPSGNRQRFQALGRAGKGPAGRPRRVASLRDGLYPGPIPAGGSSNGRTPDSDSGCLGSDPSPPAISPKPAFCNGPL